MKNRILRIKDLLFKFIIGLFCSENLQKIYENLEEILYVLGCLFFIILGFCIDYRVGIGFISGICFISAFITYQYKKLTS